MANYHVFVCLMLTIFSQHKVEGQLIDVRLVNGTTPNEGIVMYTQDCVTWETTCGLNLQMHDVIVFCRHLGFAGGNRALWNPPFGGPFHNPPTSHTNCGTGEGNIESCTLGLGCADQSTGGAVCYGSNYLGCFVDERYDRVLDDRTNQNFGGLTINKCLDFCRSYNGMAFAGVEHGTECYCGDGTSNYSRYGRVSDKKCLSPCDGSLIESCGGIGHIAIFNLTTDPQLPPPFYSPCDMTTRHIPMTRSDSVQSTSLHKSSSLSAIVSSEMSTEQQLTVSSEADTSDHGLTVYTEAGTSNTGLNNPTVAGFTVSVDTSITDAVPPKTTAGNNDTTLYTAVGGGMAGGVIACMIIILLVFGCKRKAREEREFAIGFAGKSSPVIEGFENTLVNFLDVSHGGTMHRDLEGEQGGKIEDTPAAQKK